MGNDRKPNHNNKSVLKRKRPVSSASWKPVDVTLFQEEDGVGNLTSTVRMDGRDDFGTDKTMHDDNSIDTGGKRKASSMTRNHYDDPKLSRRASKDLPMNPGEDCAMFLGLEVLDSSQYQVVNDGTSKRIVILTDSPDTTTTTTNSDKKGSKKKQEPPLSVPMEELDNNNNDGTKKSTNKKRRKSDTTTSIGSPIEGVTTIKPLTSDHQPASTVVENKKKSKRSKIEDKASSSTEYVSSSAHFKSADVELVTEPDEQNDPGQMTSTTRKKKKKKPKKKSSNTTSSTTDDANKEEGATFVIPMSRQPLSIVTPDQLATIQASWGGASGGAHLHKRLMESLFRLGFIEPTPIQAATLSASVMGRRNLVGAAPTGSGKTLAFLLPILNAILESTSTDDDDNATAVDEDDNADDDDANVEVDDPKQGRQSSRPPIHGKRGPIQALIMTPTRELASQIHAECDKLLPNQCATLVGGIALVKQARILQTKRPPIVIATPGRLWAMMTSGDHDHLKDLSQIKYLVLDEADRMTQEHSFPQLVKILDAIHDANPGEDDDDDDNDDDDDDDGSNADDEERLHGLPGVAGEAKLTMLTDDLLDQLRAQQSDTHPDLIKELMESEYDKEDLDEIDEEVVNSDEEDIFDTEPPAKARVHRQTFIYSATLTLPFTSTKLSTGKSKVGKRGKKLGLEGGIGQILDKTRAMGETKVVDLSSSSSSSANTAPGSRSGKKGVRLPPGLSLEQIKCTQRHKDSHLYAYLMTTAQGSSGPCLVFCNSIAGVRRVGATLQTLGMNVKILHAHMQQRARFKAVESLKDSKSRAVVVCTDVAARGLDIPSVSTVVHYDAARSVDTFVHRSGRTARGMGEGAIGSSISLIAPAEDKAHSKIVESLDVAFTKTLLDGRLLTAAQERTNLASKIITASEMEQKTHSSNKWFLDKAREAELDLDDGLMEDDTNRPLKESQQLLEAKKAKVRLARLLAEPMKTQRYGKFLSTNSAAMQSEVKPLIQPSTSKR